MRPLAKGDIGQRVVVEGTAINLKVGSIVQTADGVCWVYLSTTHWPEAMNNHRVRVTGTVQERSDLPVFIPHAGEESEQGIPMPEGTDLNDARKRLGIADPQCEPLD